MKTIFGFFDDYQQASQAIDKLLEKDFDLGEMNVIVLQSVAKNNMTGGLNRVKVEKTAEVDGVEVHGLERLLAGEQPVNISNLGQVYAGGDLATMLANTASANAGFKTALDDFDVPGVAAEAYRQGIMDNGLLFFLRTEDQRAAQAAMLLREEARQVASY